MTASRSDRTIRVGVRLASRAALVVALAACGGGDPAPSVVSAADTVNADAAGAQTCDLPDFSADILARVNAARAAGRSCGTLGTFGPAAALAWNDLLTQAASGHSLDMAAQNYFSHTSKDGRTFSQRIDAAGYRWQQLAENTAAGQTSVRQVIDAWLDSDDHCENLMAPALRDIGVACAPGSTSTTYRTYWTMDLGTPL